MEISRLSIESLNNIASKLMFFILNLVIHGIPKVI